MFFKGPARHLRNTWLNASFSFIDLSFIGRKWSINLPLCSGSFLYRPTLLRDSSKVRVLSTTQANCRHWTPQSIDKQRPQRTERPFISIKVQVCLTCLADVICLYWTRTPPAATVFILLTVHSIYSSLLSNFQKLQYLVASLHPQFALAKAFASSFRKLRGIGVKLSPCVASHKAGKKPAAQRQGVKALHGLQGLLTFLSGWNWKNNKYWMWLVNTVTVIFPFEDWQRVVNEWNSSVS